MHCSSSTTPAWSGPPVALQPHRRDAAFAPRKLTVFKMRWTQVGDLRSFTKGRAALLTAVRCNYLPGLPAWRVGEPILVREKDLSSVTSRRAGIVCEGGVGSFLISDLTVHDRGWAARLAGAQAACLPQRTQQKGTLE